MRTLGEIADHIGAELRGDADVQIRGLGSLGTAQAGEVSHLSSAVYREFLAGTKAAAVILTAADADACPTNALVVDQPYLAFARTTQLFRTHEHLEPGVHPTAVISADVQLGDGVAIGAHATVGPGCRLGRGVRLHPHASVGAECELGDDVEIMANAVLYRRVRMGARSIVHSGAIIGADGFGYVPGPGGRLEEIAQLGGVFIGEDVSIGACTSIDRGAIDDTIIEDGVKIDNQVQIGHNCRIGAHSLICGCVGIVGSSRVGRHCVLAGGSGIGGDKPVEICDGVTVTATTTITQSIDKPGVYAGMVLHNHLAQWKRNALRYNDLDSLFRRVKKIERQLPDKS